MKNVVTVNLDIEKLPEGQYLATSVDVQGLVAQAKTVEDVVVVAKDLAEQLLQLQNTKVTTRERFLYPMQVSV